MKVFSIILVAIIGMVLYGAYLERQNPGQWEIVGKNFVKTESLAVLAKDSFKVFSQEPVKLMALSAAESERIVYRWVDEYGTPHVSYQRPENVPNVKEIRLGDMDFKVQKSLTEQEKQQLLGQPKQ